MLQAKPKKLQVPTKIGLEGILQVQSEGLDSILQVQSEKIRVSAEFGMNNSVGTFKFLVWGYNMAPKPIFVGTQNFLGLTSNATLSWSRSPAHSSVAVADDWLDERSLDPSQVLLWREQGRGERVLQTTQCVVTILYKWVPAVWFDLH